MLIFSSLLQPKRDFILVMDLSEQRVGAQYGMKRDNLTLNNLEDNGLHNINKFKWITWRRLDDTLKRNFSFVIKVCE